VDSPLSKESRYATMNNFDLKPIAALHLHYRPESWILDQGFSAVCEKDKVPDYTEYCEDLETTWDDESNKKIGDIEMVNGENNSYLTGNYSSGKSDPSGANIGNLDLHNNSKGTTKKFPKTSLKPSFSAPNHTDYSNPINTKKLPTYVKFTTITVTATSTTIDLSNNNTMADTNIFMDEDILNDSLDETNLADQFKHIVNIGGNKGDKENGENRLGYDGKKVNSIDGQNRGLEEDQSEYNVVRSNVLEKSFGKDNKRKKNGMNCNSSGKVCDTLNDDHRNAKRIRRYEKNEEKIDEEKIDDFFLISKPFYRTKEIRKNGVAQNKSNEKQQESQKEKTTSVGAISQAKQQILQRKQVSRETEKTRREQQISQETETSHREQQVSQENSQKLLKKQLNVKKSDVGLTKASPDKQRNPKDQSKFFAQRNLESGTSGIGNINISQECPMNICTQMAVESSGFDNNNIEYIQDKQRTMKDIRKFQDNEILYDYPTINQSVNPSDNIDDRIDSWRNKKRKHVEDITDISEGRYIKKEFKEVSVKKEVDFEEEMGNNMKTNEKSGNGDNSKRQIFRAIFH
ncbi:14152_t:CDS:2, partial [Acaulospora morrowiae]